MTELVLKFEDKDELYTFSDKISRIDDPKLVKILIRENIKNSNSSLIIKSLDLPIYDVIQFKINVSEVGSFLINFEKDKIDDQKRESLITRISELRDNEEPTKDKQTEKIKKLISILAQEELIYCVYAPKGDLKLSFEDLSCAIGDIEFNFQILFIESKEKETIEKTNVKKTKEEKTTFKKFTVDYIFITIFSLLMTFGMTTGIYQIYNEQSIAAFLLVLSFIFFGVLSYAIYSVIYKKHVEISKFLKYFLLIYTTVGIIIGGAIGFVICSYVLETNVEGINIATIMIMSPLISLALSICSIFIPKLINLVTKKL